MNCEYFNNKLSAYLDGELSNRESQRVRAHVCNCRRCWEDLRELEQLRVLLRNTCTITPESNFWTDVLRAIRLEKPSRKTLRLRTMHRPSLGFALAGFVAAVLLFVLVPRPSVRNAVQTRIVEPITLVSLHADVRNDLPLADSGSMRYVFTEARSSENFVGSALEVD
jgi:anti-sigma factor RsiW